MMIEKPLWAHNSSSFYRFIISFFFLISLMPLFHFTHWVIFISSLCLCDFVDIYSY